MDGDAYLAVETASHLISRMFTLHATPTHRPDRFINIYLSKMEGKAWTCDSLTISYASPRGTNRCRSCKLHMESGAIRFGVCICMKQLLSSMFLSRHRLDSKPSPRQDQGHLSMTVCRAGVFVPGAQRFVGIGRSKCVFDRIRTKTDCDCCCGWGKKKAPVFAVSWTKIVSLLSKILPCRSLLNPK